MKKELYPRLAACGVSWKIVELIERFGVLEPRDLPVSMKERKRYEQALSMSDTPAALTIADEDFPIRLRQIPDPVYALFYQGDRSLLRKRSVSIIGSREPSSDVHPRLAFLKPLFEADIATVSGGAYGIDSYVHRLSLKHHQPTIAVLANGLGHAYPKTHLPLFGRISENGLLLSEYPAFTTPAKHQFLARNRIISALSDVLVIVEAKRKSGTMNTAGHALAQGKDIYCLPGCPTNPSFAGTNQLIAEGAFPLLNPSELVKSILMSVDK